MARKWVNSAFDDVFIEAESSSSSKQRPTKRKACHIKTPFSIDGKIREVTWVDYFAPAKKDDLAVNKKKVEQVETCLLQCFNKHNSSGQILLLTGPSGTGKTATVVALAKEHNFEIHEWRNTTRLVQHDSWKPGDPVDDTQLVAFSNFLLRASRYKSISSQIQKSVILVEDFPNMVFRDSAAFHKILRKLSKISHSPSIFVISTDGYNSNSYERDLFPKEIQDELKISAISFNPVTVAAIVKALSNILTRVQSQIDKPDLQSLAESSKGDIRNAINSLQFSKSNCKKDKKGLRSKSKTDKKSSYAKKDTALLIFHAIGKILYCKRDETGHESRLPHHMSKKQRQPLLETPEDVIQRTGSSGDSFTIFLHENYLDFMTDIDQTVHCCDAFSYSDFLRSEWAGLESMSCYSLSIPTREIMFNSTKVNRGFHAQRKPAQYDNNRIRLQRQEDMNGQFKALKLNVGLELQTHVLPYIAMINCRSLTSRQKQLAEVIVFFGRNRPDSFRQQQSAMDQLNQDKMIRMKQDDEDEEFCIDENSD